MASTIDYGNLMHTAMRGLIRTVLGDVAREGLPGDHHFFVKFDTMHPDVEIADWLSDRYPEWMTIILQHEFDDLEVTDDGFAVTLGFGGKPERLYIPYDAIRDFADPSVEFGLRFESRGTDADEEERAATAETVAKVEAKAKADSSPPDDSGPAEVVSLDRFRK